MNSLVIWETQQPFHKVIFFQKGGVIMSENENYSKEQPKEQSNEVALSELTENACEYAKLAYEQEEKREDSLINQATQMTTYFSFVSVLILMIIPIIIGIENIIPLKYTAICSVVSLAFLFLSMILAVSVQWRYKYQALPSPTLILNHIINNKNYFKTKEQRDKCFVETLNDTWDSKRIINDKRANLLRISMTLFFIAIGFIACATLFAIIVYIII